MKTRVLVYGTLRKGEGLNQYMRNFEYLGIAMLEGYKMYSNGSFPMIVEGEGEIVGEIYEIEGGKNDIAILDQIECAYTRTKVEAKIDGAWIQVQTYIYNHSIDNLDKINSGNWLSR